MNCCEYGTRFSPVKEYFRGKYHCTIDLLFDWFGISCVTTHKFCFYLQNKSKPVKQEVNCTLILPPLVFPGQGVLYCRGQTLSRKEERQ
jgi:hypothetical protein